MCEKDTTGHDWWHIHRVVKNAITIGKKEKADLFIVQMAALLHDLDDWKFNKSFLLQKKTSRLLKKLKVDEQTSRLILNITTHISFKGGLIKQS
ncbi:MAG TPA: HD domain-containing protein [Coxiellaceae bacterium]|nr:HD domain-containing protein [Coxiellaceae bacterium]